LVFGGLRQCRSIYCQNFNPDKDEDYNKLKHSLVRLVAKDTKEGGIFLPGTTKLNSQMHQANMQRVDAMHKPKVIWTHFDALEGSLGHTVNSLLNDMSVLSFYYYCHFFKVVHITVQLKMRVFLKAYTYQQRGKKEKRKEKNSG